MKDEEVGEIWCEINQMPEFWQVGRADIRGLIRKLVEERQLQYVASGNSLEYALRDFGIDPKEWK